MFHVSKKNGVKLIRINTNVNIQPKREHLFSFSSIQSL